jgi:hypothetical protein
VWRKIGQKVASGGDNVKPSWEFAAGVAIIAAILNMGRPMERCVVKKFVVYSLTFEKRLQSVIWVLGFTSVNCCSQRSVLKLSELKVG